MYHATFLFRDRAARDQGVGRWVIPAYSAYKQKRASFCLQVGDWCFTSTVTPEQAALTHGGGAAMQSRDDEKIRERNGWR